MESSRGAFPVTGIVVKMSEARCVLAMVAHEKEPIMIAGMPAYSTLMELRTAGWTLQEIAQTYGVSEINVQTALATHFLWRAA